MKDLSKYTPTELLKKINDVEEAHRKLKESTISDIDEAILIEKQLKDLEYKINNNTTQLKKYEEEYIDLIEEINNR